jgi:hypothetical protein
MKTMAGVENRWRKGSRKGKSDNGGMRGSGGSGGGGGAK